MQKMMDGTGEAENNKLEVVHRMVESYGWAIDFMEKYERKKR
jgi:hypothetical protein